MSKIIITCGDPAGVGPEIIKKWWEANPQHRACTKVAGPITWAKQLPGITEDSILAVGGDFEISPGNPCNESAKVAWDAMEIAASECAKINGAVVTGPVNKANLNAIGYEFPGQTEFFAKAWGGKPTMAFWGPELRVFLATWHIPLVKVAEALNESVLEKTISDAASLFKKLGVSEPRLAVCGLNPHAGENGLLGTEEKAWINPLLERLTGRHPNLCPAAQPADTLFYRHRKGEFDGIIALYHDQALGPVKTLEFDTSVNITLGLPYVRTSPDHGTAYDIAGKGIANSGSFTRAYELALEAMSDKSVTC